MAAEAVAGALDKLCPSIQTLCVDGMSLVKPLIGNAVKKFLRNSGVDTLYIEPGSPWENGYIESFNSKLRDELLNRELFYILTN